MAQHQQRANAAQARRASMTHRQPGQSLIELALLLGCVALIALGALTFGGQRIRALVAQTDCLFAMLGSSSPPPAAPGCNSLAGKPPVAESQPAPRPVGTTITIRGDASAPSRLSWSRSLCDGGAPCGGTQALSALSGPPIVALLLGMIALATVRVWTSGQRQ